MRIVSFGQSVNVDNLSQVVHHFTVVTDDEQVYTLPATEELVAALMKISSEEVPEETYQYSEQERVVEEDVPVGGNGQTEWSEEGIEFGGDVDPGEVAREDPQEAVMGAIAEEPATEPQQPSGIGQAKPKPQPIISTDGKQLTPRAKTVPKDSAGYPIAPQQQPKRVQTQLPVGDDEDGTQI